MYHSFLIHSSADGHLGCFHVLAMINSAAMNVGVHVSLSDLVSSVCMPRSGIAGLYGSSKISKWFLLACLIRLSCVQLIVTLWTAAHQPPLSMGFSRQEYWSGLPCPPPGDLPKPGTEPASLMSPALAGGFFTGSITWAAPKWLRCTLKFEKRWAVDAVTVLLTSLRYFHYFCAHQLPVCY